MKSRTKFLALTSVWIVCIATLGCASTADKRVSNLVSGQDQVTRARFATLLAEECELSRLPAGYKGDPAGKPFVTPSEHLAALGAATVKPPESRGVGNTLAADLERAIELRLRGLGERGADGTMDPEAPLTRAELALVLEDLLVLGTGDASYSQKLLGSTSPFPDLRSDHYAFNAALVATTRGLLETGPGRAFEPDRPVRGDEALAAIKKLNERINEKTPPQRPAAVGGSGDRA